MRLTSWLALVWTQVGIKPMVVPLSGSTAISGTGMNGAVAGLNQRDQPLLTGAGSTTMGPGGTSESAAGGMSGGVRPALPRQPGERGGGNCSPETIHYNNRLKLCSSRSMSALFKSPMVEIRNSECDKLPWPA